MISLGIDVGGSSVKVAAIREGKTLWSGQSPRYEKPDRASLVNAIRTACGQTVTDVATVGLCVPGLIDAGGKHVTVSVNIPGLVGVPLAHLVAEVLGGELRSSPRVVNDTHAAAHDLVISRELTGRVLVLSLGTGVGGSVLDDGVPLWVDGITPGHFGQLDVSLDDVPPIGPDGGAGGLEAYIGAPALTRQYGDPGEGVLAFRGDEPPVRALARTIRIAHAIYRPHHIILAGGIGVRLRGVLPALKSRVESDLTRLARPGWTLSCADDEYHAARGAALLALAIGMPAAKT